MKNAIHDNPISVFRSFIQCLLTTRGTKDRNVKILERPSRQKSVVPDFVDWGIWAHQAGRFWMGAIGVGNESDLFSL